MFPRLCIDVVQFCSKSASSHSLSRKKLSSGSHKVHLSESRTVGVIPTSRLLGPLHCFCPRAPKTLVTPMAWCNQNLSSPDLF